MYNESYPLPVGFFKNSWAIWEEEHHSKTAYLNGSDDGKRFCTQSFFYVDRPTTISFSGGDNYQYCTVKAENATGANAVWDKLYNSGNTHILQKGFHAITIKKLSGNEEQSMDEFDYRNFKFTLTPSTL